MGPKLHSCINLAMRFELPRTGPSSATFLSLYSTTNSKKRGKGKAYSLEPFEVGMRPGKGCESCRERHLKCVITDRQSACTRCAEVGRDCNFSPRFKFRRVSHVDTASQGVRSRTTLEYEDNQTWVSTGKPIGFILEDGSGLEHDATDSYTSHIDELGDNGALNASYEDQNSLSVDDVLPNAIRDGGSLQQSNTIQQEERGWLANQTPRSDIRTARQEVDVSSPASIVDLTRRYEDNPNLSQGFTSGAQLATGNSPALSPATSLLTPGGLPSLNLSRREAFLVHHFVHKIAPWVGDNVSFGSGLTHRRLTRVISHVTSPLRYRDVLCRSQWFYILYLHYLPDNILFQRVNLTTRRLSTMRNAWAW